MIYRARHHWWFFIRTMLTGIDVLAVGLAATGLVYGTLVLTSVLAVCAGLGVPSFFAWRGSQKTRGWAASTAASAWLVAGLVVVQSVSVGLFTAVFLAAAQLAVRAYVWSNSWIEISELTVEYTTRESILKPRDNKKAVRDQIQGVEATHGTWVEELAGSWDVTIRTASDSEIVARDLCDGRLVAAALAGEEGALLELASIPVVERGGLGFGGLGGGRVLVVGLVVVGVGCGVVVGLLSGWVFGLGLVAAVLGAAVFTL